MNLAKIYQILSDYDVEALKPNFHIETSRSGLRTINFYDVLRFKESLNILLDLGIISDKVSSLRDSYVYRQTNDIASMPEPDAAEIISTMTSLYHSVLDLLSVLRNEFPVDGPNTLRIKLPPVDNFTEMGSIMKDLNHAISTPLLNPSIDAHVKILRGEPGSVWLVVAISSIPGLVLIGDLIWSAYILTRERIESNRVLEIVGKYDMTPDLRQQFVETQENHIKNLREKEVSGIITRNELRMNDHQDIERLSHAVETIATLSGRGAEFLPGNSASEDVVAAFPTQKEQLLLVSKVKELTE